MNKPPAKITRAQWIVRIIFAVVFFLNIQCAFQFIVSPEHYLAAYELEGVATYPLYLINPIKYPTLGIIILAQQVIGLIGESTLLFSLPPEHDLLYDSIVRFICFDGIGLVAMGVVYALLYTTLRQAKRNHH